MSAPDRAAAFARWWVDRYTAPLPAEVADRRRAEIRCDVWEQRAWAARTDASPVAVAVSITRRVLAGMAADLYWWRAQQAAARGRSASSSAAMWSWTRRTWWQALAVLLGGLEVGTGVSTPFEDPTTGGLTAGVITAAAGLLVLVGVAVRRGRRAHGDVMIAVGVLPVVPWYWTYVFPITGVIVVAAALVDAADAQPSRTAALPRADDRVRVVLVAALIVALAAGVVIGSASRAVVLIAPVLAALVVHAVVRRRSDLAAAARAGLLMAGVGVGNGVFTVVVVALSAANETVLATDAVAAAAVISALAIAVGVTLLVVARRTPTRWSRRA